MTGAYLLTQVSAETAKRSSSPISPRSASICFNRGIMHRHTERRPKVVEPLDWSAVSSMAAGGGGWGAIVTSKLAGPGQQPAAHHRTVNTAEFFLTVTISLTLHPTLGWEAFTVATLGLLIGGVAAAPFGGMIANASIRFAADFRRRLGDSDQ